MLWHDSDENVGPFIIAPEGKTLLVPVQGGDLLLYRLEDGTLLQRMHPGLNESIQALVYDHDGGLWLATEEQLVQYQPRG
jgi:ligand-binding sensor domain-containing protein